MISVAYFSPETKIVLRLLKASDLAAMPTPTSDELAVLTEYESGLPAYVDGQNVRRMPAKPSVATSWSGEALAWVPSSAEETQLALAELMNSSLRIIDRVAGQVRMRYITSAPGQAETYQRKEQQAREWLASGFAGVAPSFIAAEAQALGVQPQVIAQEIIDTADLWSNVKGPAIEAARRAGKVAIQSATTIEAIEAARDAAIAALDAL
jgi:hypothetical protein